ncbi:MAG: Holliday junction resolvase RuvX [Flavobacteriaceae bacterium]|nr:Holliday junction resolvase RuvX [Flavobacteriaceae bacterium]MDG1343866.1 Holliday junction resolvase RuvX [Flavobacteriaceae bacterium]MDG1792761.1 Holliday junction resolvase RuvX [Flavobacteriaceae bacterium]MDG2485506.1 Holliday junction resolvase RuvX [Flavobacteriaceae bacterium]|tara:strand:- start:1948 stop:2358 length:411 start_codon:yes stop_codon:yes gene_type:complete
MSKIVALDFGTKRIGVAMTDDLNIIASGLDTVSNENILSFLKDLTLKNKIDTIVIGKPLQKNNQPSDVEAEILKFINILKINFPLIKLDRYDERFTSVIAKKVILDSGINKTKRRNKSLVDKISATIILQSYLENI